MSINAEADSAGQARVVEIEERTWLPRHQRGDPDAFAALLAAYQRPVYSYLVRCGVVEPARDDLFQDVFLKIHAAAASYRPDQPLRPWIFAIAANTVRNYFRALRPHLSWDEADTNLPDPGPGVDQNAEFLELIDWLAQAIPTLPLAQREVLNLVAIEGLRLQEAAEILDLPINTIKTHLRRARLSLIKALTSREAGGGGSDDTL